MVQAFLPARIALKQNGQTSEARPKVRRNARSSRAPHKRGQKRLSPTWNRGEIYAGARHLATYDNGTSGTTYFNHEDWLGTERARSNVSAEVCETITSLPYGDDQNASGACSDSSPMHFTGKMRDIESNLDDFDARYYSSQWGPFRISDPANIRGDVEDFSDPQGWNGYAYVRNNPSDLTDPDGMSYRVCIRDGKSSMQCSDYNSDADFRKAVQDSPGASTQGNNDSGQIIAGGKVVGTYDRIDVDLPSGVADMLHRTGMMSDAEGRHSAGDYVRPNSLYRWSDFYRTDQGRRQRTSLHGCIRQRRRRSGKVSEAIRDSLGRFLP